MRRSPYLNDYRLEDIIAAIQVMSLYPWASREDWSPSLDEPLSVGTKNWDDVFMQHPEFFRIRSGYTTLRLRYSYEKNFDPNTKKEYSKPEIEDLSTEQRDGLTYKPLSQEKIEILIRTAIELHSRAIAQSEERRWWKPVLLGSIFTLAGTIIGFLGSWGSICLK